MPTLVAQGQIHNCGIYCIRNLINNKRYVCLSTDIYMRWRYHRSDLNCNTHPNIHLQNAWNKYGSQNFVFEILEECIAEELATKEMFYIGEFNTFGENGYNMTIGGNGMSGTTQYYERLLSGESICSIARNTGLSRNTITRIKSYNEYIVFSFILQRLGIIEKDSNYETFERLLKEKE